jgi:hypothetical protein
MNKNNTTADVTSVTSPSLHERDGGDVAREYLARLILDGRTNERRVFRPLRWVEPVIVLASEVADLPPLDR